MPKGNAFIFASKSASAEQYNDASSSQDWELSDFQNFSRGSIIACQHVAGHGSVFGVWETPEEITGQQLKANLRRIVYRHRIISFVSAQALDDPRVGDVLDEAEIWISRYALLLRFGPSSMVRRNSSFSLDVTSIAGILTNIIPKIIGFAVCRKLADAGSSTSGNLLSYLTDVDIHFLKSTRATRGEMNRVDRLVALGLWSDSCHVLKLGSITDPTGDPLPVSAEPQVCPFLPFSDSYLAEFGPRVLWTILDLGPNLIDLAKSLPSVIGGLKSPRGEFQRRIARYFSQTPWLDRDGEIIRSPPFKLRTGSNHHPFLEKDVADYEWPPRTWQQVYGLLTTLQSAHLWIALLSLAGRLQEVLMLTKDCVEQNCDGQSHVNGKTYKLSPLLAGEDREWPAPEILGVAIAQQVQLIEACEDVSWINLGDTSTKKGTHLWWSFGTGGAIPGGRLVEVNHALVTLAMRLDLPIAPDGQNIHAHRFRKTIARLAALAIVESPRVLMQLFGHRDIAMTLHYILTDKALQTDIEQISRELRIMRCTDVVEDIYASLHNSSLPPDGGHGGGGVRYISDAIKNKEGYLKLNDDKWSATSAYELAVALTLNGQYFRIIRPGVLCMRPAKDFEPCECKSDCVNRIESQTARRDLVELIPLLLAEGNRALENGQLLVVANIVGQLEDEISRFEDFNKVWSDHPDVMKLRKALEAE
ncbi:hypothetical protein [Pseudomonas sp. S2_H01]